MAGVPRYLPFDGPAFRLRVGLRPLDPAAWLELDERYDAELAEKARLLAERPGEVVAWLPGSHEPSAELLDLVVDHLEQHHPDIVARVPGGLRNLRTGERLRTGVLHPVDAAGRLVQEDLLVLDRRHGDLVLVAASLCFPSRWRLADKLGLGMAAIHGPVPGYAAQLSAATDAALARLRPERPVWRLNWSLHDDPALFQPAGHGRTAPAAGVTPADAGETVWLRVERQTLRRLPRTGAVAFGIRTHQWPLAQVAGDPAACRALAAHLRTMPGDFAAYKSLPPLRAAVLAWLDERA